MFRHVTMVASWPSPTLGQRCMKTSTTPVKIMGHAVNKLYFFTKFNAWKHRDVVRLLTMFSSFTSAKMRFSISTLFWRRWRCRNPGTESSFTYVQRTPDLPKPAQLTTTTSFVPLSKLSPQHVPRLHSLAPRGLAPSHI